MNLITYAPLWLAALTAIALLAGAAEDMIRLRISNITVLIVLATAIAAMAFAGFPAALWQNALVFLGILVLGTLAFSSCWGEGTSSCSPRPDCGSASMPRPGFSPRSSSPAEWSPSATSSFARCEGGHAGKQAAFPTESRLLPGRSSSSARNIPTPIVSGLCRRSKAFTCRNDRGRRAEPPTSAISVASPTRSVRVASHASRQRAGDSHCGTWFGAFFWRFQ